MVFSPAKVYIFVSYARRDGAELAVRLQKDLTIAGFVTWLDKQRIDGGASWTAEIEEAIDRAQVVLALLTSGSYASEICRAEQLRSLRKGKCVVPLLAATGTDIPLHLEAKNYRDFTGKADYAASFQSLLADIEARNGVVLSPHYRTTPAAYITAPPNVANYIDRPQALRAVRDMMFEQGGSRAIALTAIVGMGGIGKTVLAQALFKDEVVRQAFPDGLIWITVGREANYDLTARMREITRELGVATDDAISPETQYKTAIAQKAVLLVLDDIWSKADLDPYLAESPRSRFLFTTRDASIGRFSSAREQQIDVLDAQQSRELLALWAGLDVTQLPAAAEDVLRECGSLPLALSTVGALLRGATPADWTDTAELLRDANLSAIEQQLPVGQMSFFRAIDVSVKALPASLQRQYERLAVLPRDMPAPLVVLQTLWNLDEGEARRAGRQLADRSLAYRDESGGIRLHDLQLDYVRARHARPDVLALIHGALRLSFHVIETEPREFASQVIGRLLSHRDSPAIQQFIDEIAAGAPEPWLRPLQPALHPPGTALLLTLEGHTAAVTSVAVAADGKRAVSASQDQTLRVWDLETGRVQHTLEGHSDAVCSVAMTTDGKRALSASWDDTLKLWDLDTGLLLRTIKRDADADCVAISGDGKRAVSASWDKVLRVWEPETGRVLGVLKGHTRRVYGVAIAADGTCAASVSWDGTLRVWNLESGKVLRKLKGQHLPARDVPTRGIIPGCVAVTADGKRAVFTSSDKELKVCDLATGRVLHTLRGHSDIPGCAAVTEDGKRIVSGSRDWTLKVWDSQTGRLLGTLDGHSGRVFSVAVTANGKRAVSASLDRTVKVWSLDIAPTLRSIEGHPDHVSDIALTPEGRWAVSASEDGTLKLWDLDTCSVVRTMKPDALQGHSGKVMGVAVTPDGKQALTASWDNTVKVWDLETGRLLRTLKGHSGGVHGVAVTGDGKWVVSTAGDNTLKVWNLTNGRVLRTLQGHSAPVFRVTLSQDGSQAISASWDHTLKVWDLHTGRVLRTLKGHSSWVFDVAATVDWKRAVSVSQDKTLKVWNLKNGKVVWTLKGHSEDIYCVALTPDGSKAVSVSKDRTLKAWDLNAGLLIATFHCDAAMSCCAFIDERRIIACAAGGRVYFLALEDSRSLHFGHGDM
jgi:WD40 repeat protein